MLLRHLGRRDHYGRLLEVRMRRDRRERDKERSPFFIPKCVVQEFLRYFPDDIG